MFSAIPRIITGFSLLLGTVSYGHADANGDDFLTIKSGELNSIKNFIANHPDKNVLVVRGQYDRGVVENGNILNDEALAFAGLALDNSETQGTGSNAFKLDANADIVAPANFETLTGENEAQGLVNLIIASNAFSDFCAAETSNTQKNFFGFANRENNSAFPHVQLGGQAVCYDDGNNRFPILNFYPNLGGCGAIFDVTGAAGMDVAGQQLTCAGAQGQSAKNHKSRGSYLRPAKGFNLPDGATRNTAISDGSELYQSDVEQSYFLTPGSSIFGVNSPGSQTTLLVDGNGRVTLKANMTYLVGPFAGSQNISGAVFENPSFQTITPQHTELTHQVPINTQCNGGNVLLSGAVASKLAGIKTIQIYRGSELLETKTSPVNAIFMEYSFIVPCPVSGTTNYTFYVSDKIVNRSRDKIMGLAPHNVAVSKAIF